MNRVHDPTGSDEPLPPSEDTREPETSVFGWFCIALAAGHLVLAYASASTGDRLESAAEVNFGVLWALLAVDRLVWARRGSRPAWAGVALGIAVGSLVIIVYLFWSR